VTTLIQEEQKNPLFVKIVGNPYKEQGRTLLIEWNGI